MAFLRQAVVATEVATPPDTVTAVPRSTALSMNCTVPAADEGHRRGERYRVPAVVGLTGFAVTMVDVASHHHRHHRRPPRR